MPTCVADSFSGSPSGTVCSMASRSTRWMARPSLVEPVRCTTARCRGSSHLEFAPVTSRPRPCRGFPRGRPRSLSAPYSFDYSSVLEDESRTADFTPVTHSAASMNRPAPTLSGNAVYTSVRRSVPGVVVRRHSSPRRFIVTSVVSPETMRTSSAGSVEHPPAPDARAGRPSPVHGVVHEIRVRFRNTHLRLLGAFPGEMYGRNPPSACVPPRSVCSLAASARFGQRRRSSARVRAPNHSTG